MATPRRGLEGFHQQYGEWFGDRWQTMVKALAKPNEKVSLLNPFVGSAPLKGDPEFKDWPVELSKVAPPASTAGLASSYELDLASIAAAAALPLRPGDEWLDLCAAPGGKALTNIFRLQGNLLTTANEMSAPRHARLKAVFHDYLPAPLLAKVHFTRRDGLKWHAVKDKFSAILVDAPCSGERHLLSKPSELSHWSLKRSQGLAIRQHGLLCAALEAVKPGGHLLYSTCSLSPLENDQVIDKLLERRSERVQVVEAKMWMGQRSSHGVNIHPDQTGWGPIYYCLLQKN